jgi:choline dehydrogenase-like flavoprotein
VASRPNLSLLTYARVNEIKFSNSGPTKTATGVTIQPRGGGDVITVSAKREIILAAGFMSTPQILQRSGIGPAALLEQANVPLVVDLPGVGV